MIEFLIVMAVLTVLYIVYRLFVFNPELKSRFAVIKPITFSSITVQVFEFNKTILNLITSSDLIKVMSAGVKVDYAVSIVISAALVLIITAIVRFREMDSGCSLRPLLFSILLYITSTLPYIASNVIYVSSTGWSGAFPYPIRYLQVSGFLLTASFCLGAASFGSKIRKLILVLVVCFSGVGAILTFGVKTPTVEAASEYLKTEITAAKAHGGTRVMFISTPNSGGFIDPYFLDPATSALKTWWIIENYCPMVWGLLCVHGESGVKGDIVVYAETVQEGFLPTLKVELIK